MRERWLWVGLAVLLAAPACESDKTEPKEDSYVAPDPGTTSDVAAELPGDAADDAGPPPPRPCADTSQVYAFPTPAWQSGAMLAAPAGDAVAALFEEHRPDWFAQLPLVDGWAIRPTVVVPLDAAASAVDASAIRLFGRSAIGKGELAEHPAELAVTLVADDRALLIVPHDPIPAEVLEVVLAFEPGAVTGAIPLPACGADGQPDPAYDVAATALPAELSVTLALPFRLATTTQALPKLRARMADAPVLTVDSIEARTLDSFGDKAPPPEVAAHLAATAAHAILELPDYRRETGGFEVGADGVPVAQGTTKPGIIVALPATGSAPFPFVLFQHGGTQDKADLFQLAGPLAEAGFALVGIDLPYHGDRGGAGGGNDLDIVNFMDPIGSRENFRQAAADHLALLTGLDALNTALEPILGHAETLDAGRPFYMGLSLGALTGSLTFAAGQSLRASALFVGGGHYPDLLSFGLFGVFVMDLNDLPPVERAIIFGLAEALLDGADPIAYAQRAEDRAAAPRPALFFQAVGETIIIPVANDQWARAYGADLVKPLDHSVPGMLELDLPANDNFSWAPGGATATRALIQCPMAEVDPGDRHAALIVQGYSQQLVAHCFRTLRDDGSCEVIDTGWQQH